VQGLVPNPAVADLLRTNFVGLAADCDAPEPEVVDLVQRHLADGMMLPFVIFTDANGKFLAGSHGAVRLDDLASTLEDLVS